MCHTFGHCPFGGEGWFRHSPGWFGALIYRHNGDFANFLKLVPECPVRPSPRVPGWVRVGGLNPIWEMPKCRAHQPKRVFPKSSSLYPFEPISLIKNRFYFHTWNTWSPTAVGIDARYFCASKKLACTFSSSAECRSLVNLLSLPDWHHSRRAALKVCMLHCRGHGEYANKFG